MIRALLVAALLTACGGQGGERVRGAFDDAGLPLEERELTDGTTVWSSNSDEDVIAEISGDPVDKAYLMVPPLDDDIAEGFPGSRYVDVLDETLASGLRDWIEEEAEGRSGSWSEEREFGAFTVEIENDTQTLPSFNVSIERSDG